MEELKMNNLKLVRTENFENTISCDFWADINDEYFVTREQIGRALGYSDPRIAVAKIHTKHKDRLDKFSTVTRTVTVEGDKSVERERVFYSRKGIMEICRWSRQPVADKFMDWCWDIIDRLLSDQYSMTSSNKITNLISLIDDVSNQNSLLLSQNRNLEHKIARLENMVCSLMPPTKHSEWKRKISQKIKYIAKQLGLEGNSEIKSIYGEIYNIMRNDYGLDVSNYKGDYTKTHTDVDNPPAIDIVDNYDELKSLFESIVDNYIEIKATSKIN